MKPIMEEKNSTQDQKGNNKIHSSSSYNQDTLLKYEYPVVVSTYDKNGTLPSKLIPREPGGSENGKIIDFDKRQTEETLNIILPPREWEDNGKLWRQKVSSTPAKRTDVILLEEQLNDKLKQRQARPFGICPIRRELYTQCFDELIRQVTINCAERGLLLMKVRDEAVMTLVAYRSLYESATGYGFRTALMEEAKKVNIGNTLSTNMEQKLELEMKVKELKSKLNDLEQTHAEQKMSDDKKHENEIEYLRAINNQIKQQLESLIIPVKKGAQPA